MRLNHVAFYSPNVVSKERLISELQSGSLISELALKKGAVFSEITLNALIAEEQIHGQYEVLQHKIKKQRLLTYSEGERKKALLHYILSKKPAYIIVDNVLDNLDLASQTAMIENLKVLGEEVQLIQLSSRKHEILPFIKQVYYLNNGQWVLGKTHTMNSKDVDSFSRQFPKAYEKITVDAKVLVNFNKVDVAYNGVAVLENVSLEIKKNEFWQITGPNGAGKSTLLSLITGDNVKGYGQDITLFGIKKGSGESVWEHKRKIGYFSSEMKLGFARKTTLENMILSGFFDSIGLYDKPSKIQINILVDWLHLLRLYELRKKNFLFLTLGQQRLVLIARAMIKQPPLLILDEPTAGLDDEAIRLLVALINKIHSETDTTILYVSHKHEKGLHPTSTFEL